MKALAAIAVMLGLGWMAAEGGPRTAACTFGARGLAESVGDGVSAANLVVIGDVLSVPGPVRDADLLRVDRVIKGEVGAGDVVPILRVTPCGDPTPPLPMGRYMVFLREGEAIDGRAGYLQPFTSLLPVVDGRLAGISKAGAARELRGMAESEASAYAASAWGAILSWSPAASVALRPSTVYRTPPRVDAGAVRKNRDLRGLLRQNGGVLIGRVSGWRATPGIGADAEVRTQYDIDVLAWLKRPRGIQQRTEVSLSQRGALLGDALFEIQADPLMQTGELYLFVLRASPDRGTSIVVELPTEGLRLRIDRRGRLQPVHPWWLLYGGIRELAGLPLAAAVPRILAAAEAERQQVR